MSHPLQMLHGHRSLFGEVPARYQGNEIGGKSDLSGSHYNSSGVRMSFNIRERETSYS